MAKDNQNGTDLESNGTISSKRNNRDGTRFDKNRDLSSPNESDDDDNGSDINKLKEKNKDLKYIVGKIQKQLDNFTKEVQKNNDIIIELQKEKKTTFRYTSKKVTEKITKEKKK